MTQQPQPRRPFNSKGMTTFIVTLGFLVLGISGIVLYVSPRGWVANWTDWSVLGLNKEAWAALHTATALLFLLAAFLYLYYNWTTFWSYFKMRFEKGFNLKREFAAALLICGLVLAGTVWGIPPMSNLADWNEDIKDHWETASAQPPVAHAEEWTLSQMAENRGLELDAMVARLKENGYVVSDTSKTIKSIAEENNVSPDALFGRISPPRSGGGESHGQGVGMGRKTLAEYCEQHGIPVPDALDRLSAAGITADAGQTMRAIADAVGMTPADVADAGR